MNLLTMVRNASANIARVVVSAIAALFLPRILLGALSPEGYGIWVLIVQVGLYSSYLNFGISTIVGRSVAYYTETHEDEKRNQIVNTGLAILIGSALVATLFVALASPFFGRIFQEIPRSALPEARTTLILVSAAIAMRLPSAILSAVFIGLQRNEYPLVFVLIEKILLLVAVFVAARMGGSLLTVGIAYSLALLCTFTIELLVFLRFPSGVRLRTGALTRSAAKEILRGAAALALVSFASLLISGLDTVIVGAIDFQSVVAFSLAVTLTNLVIQVQSAAVNVIMPVAASLAGQQNNRSLVSLLFRGTRYGTWTLLLIGVTLAAIGPEFIRIWVGEEFVSQVMPLLVALIIATILRQATLTSTNLVVGVGKLPILLVPALIGGLVNVICSIVLTMRMGAIGAAIGTIIGALFEISLHVFFVAPRILELGTSPWQLLRSGYLQPWLTASPAIVLVILWLRYIGITQQPLIGIGIGIAVALLIAGVGWRTLLHDADRFRLQKTVQRLQYPWRTKSA